MFWTNTAHQVAFLNQVATVNSLRQQIKDAIAPGAGTPALRLALAAAKDAMDNAFEVLRSDWVAYLATIATSFVEFHTSGGIIVWSLPDGGGSKTYVIVPYGAVATVPWAGSVSWEDFARYLFLYAAIVEAVPVA